MIAGAGPDTPLQQSFASVRHGEQALGAGVLVADRLVLTCAHVVNSALGRDRFAQDTPAPATPSPSGCRMSRLTVT